jgi:hypothetical protein
MQPDVFQLIGYGSLFLLLAYVAFFIWRRRVAPKAPVADVSDAHVQAIRENSELLRELIAVNRQLLETKDRPDT